MNEMLLTANKAAKKLGIKESQFRRAVKRGEITPACINSRPKMWAVSQLDSIGKSSHASTTNFSQRIKDVFSDEIR